MTVLWLKGRTGVVDGQVRWQAGVDRAVEEVSPAQAHRGGYCGWKAVKNPSGCTTGL